MLTLIPSTAKVHILWRLYRSTGNILVTFMSQIKHHLYRLLLICENQKIQASYLSGQFSHVECLTELP